MTKKQIIINLVLIFMWLLFLIIATNYLLNYKIFIFFFYVFIFFEIFIFIYLLITIFKKRKKVEEE